MGRLIYHRKKDSGTTYVYEVVEEHWDKQLKQMRSKQVCVGKLDPDTNELIPSKRARSIPPDAVTASTTIIGSMLILDKIAQDTGLKETLKRAFPEQWTQILTLAAFLACRGDALVHADAWCRNHAVTAAGPFVSQRISEWLAEITEDRRQTFFKAWGKKVSGKELLCYDITSVSSYSQCNEYIHYGYNRDGEPLPQINLALVYGQESRLPVICRTLPGPITDVVTVKNLLDGFDKLEYPAISLVMDRGFYSQKNVTDLFDRHYSFIIGVPGHLKWVRAVFDCCQDAMQSPRGYRQMDDECLYMHTEMVKWPANNRRCYLHVYYNAHRASDDYEALTRRLLQCKKELVSGKLDPAHEQDYEQYFIVKTTPVRGMQVDFNDEVIKAYRNRYAGFFAIMTTRKLDALETLQIYRNKDVVEKCFDDLKNQLDLKRLRIHSSQQMSARIFVQFIAMIFMSRIQKTMRESTLSERYSPRLLLEEMESLTRIHYTGKYKDITSEVSKSQREILEAFSIDPNTL